MYPGKSRPVEPPPMPVTPAVQGSGKLAGRVALITGGDSGIGRAVALAFAREGANVAIVYRNEHKGAAETRRGVEAQGRSCLVLPADLRLEGECHRVMGRVLDRFGRLDVLVCNHAVPYPQKSMLDISSDQLEDTFQTNFFSLFYLTQAALPWLERGSIINTVSAAAAYGEEQRPDYSAAQGAILSLTRSLARSLAGKGIRVNGVAPGPAWRQRPAAGDSAESRESMDGIGPIGQHVELAEAYVFLAAEGAALMTGQVLYLDEA